MLREDADLVEGAQGAAVQQRASGRWWRDEVVEVDVLGLLDGRTRLLGEARWQASPVDHRDLHSLTRKLEHLPEPHEGLEVALWSRGGAVAELAARPGVHP